MQADEVEAGGRLGPCQSSFAGQRDVPRDDRRVSGPGVRRQEEGETEEEEKASGHEGVGQTLAASPFGHKGRDPCLTESLQLGGCPKRWC